MISISMFPHLVKQEEFLTADFKQAYHAAGATVSKPGSKGTYHLRFSGIRPLRGYPPPIPP